MSARRIDVVIEELNFHGLEPQQRVLLAVGLERELERLFSSFPHQSRNVFVERMTAPAVRLVPRAASVPNLATRLAERIYGAAVASGSRDTGGSRPPARVTGGSS